LPFSFYKDLRKIPKNLEIGKLEIFELKNLNFNGSGFSGCNNCWSFSKNPNIVAWVFLGLLYLSFKNE
jgi:hypothetical protein